MSSSLTEKAVNGFIRIIIRSLLKIDYREFDRVPRSGPGLFISNHTTNLEGPIYYVLFQPRESTGLAKTELWNNVITRFLMQIWEMIPVKRGRMDSRAMKKVDKAIQNRKFLGIAPEGTRSKDGQLQRGMPGTALIATRYNCPVIPLVQWGLTDLFENIVKLRRTPVEVRVGKPFYVRTPDGSKPTRTELRVIADEIMYQLAVLLPEKFRGVYRDLTKMTTDYIIRA